MMHLNLYSKKERGKGDGDGQKNKERERDRDRENSNSKMFTLKIVALNETDRQTETDRE